MKCYLEIEVPVRYDPLWFKELRDACKGVDVRWQRAWHHITMAFLDEMPAGVNFRGILDRHLKHYQAPELTFDKVDSFRTKSGMPIIYLSVTHVPKDFEAIVQAIRNDFETAGCKMQSAFKLHVTLGRVTDAAINVRALQRITASIQPPPFSLKLQKINFTSFQGKTPHTTPSSHSSRGMENYLPMQKWEKISPRMSSVEISPVISPR